eukprot:CAMPEP_0114495168 /NCGR_PEP_ID=MMETSP0109-20121206/5056_1 /TAXON_ID=29199 /ORGANISM="Chlorarachnion reptans, Strain CCCM449" /LENGTH=319 /DNA_ID=CAMNT_0001672283 /DNA_START=138 /DNA_END=1097 /DNA_ORIENTATION=-
MADTSEAKIIDGKAVATEIRAEIKKAVVEMKEEHKIVPGLGTILVGNRSDSAMYVRFKKKAAAAAGFHTVDVKLEDTVTEENLIKEVEKLAADEKVHGILVQLPLPKHINESNVLKAIPYEKDVDGFCAKNIGNLILKGGEPPLAVACTPAGCVELIQRTGVDTKGLEAVVLGRSNIVGMPMEALLRSMDATVTVCHSRTKNVESHVRRADIVVAAMGKPEYVKGEWIKPGAIVIDVGINSVDDSTKKRGYRLVGDVEFEVAKKRAGYITPVPGGVGPMTIAMLMRNTYNLARHTLKLPRIPLRTSRKYKDAIDNGEEN